MGLKFNQLNKRQEEILTILDKKKNISVSELIILLIKKDKKVSRITVVRDLNKLLKFNFIKELDEAGV